MEVKEKEIKEEKRKSQITINKIIQRLRRLTGKRFHHLENALSKMIDLELESFSSFLREIDYEMNTLKRKASRRIF